MLYHNILHNATTPPSLYTSLSPHLHTTTQVTTVTLSHGPCDRVRSSRLEHIDRNTDSPEVQSRLRLSLSCEELLQDSKELISEVEIGNEAPLFYLPQM